MEGTESPPLPNTLPHEATTLLPPSDEGKGSTQLHGQKYWDTVIRRLQAYPYLTSMFTKTLHCERNRIFGRDRVENILKVRRECLDLQDLCSLGLGSINEMSCTEFLDERFMFLGSGCNDPRKARKMKKFKSFKSARKMWGYTCKTDLTRSPNDKQSFPFAVRFTTFEGERKSKALVRIIECGTDGVECNWKGCRIVV